jgi:hypothetical protein
MKDEEVTSSEDWMEEVPPVNTLVWVSRETTVSPPPMPFEPGKLAYYAHIADHSSLSLLGPRAPDPEPELTIVSESESGLEPDSDGSAFPNQPSNDNKSFLAPQSRPQMIDHGPIDKAKLFG